MLNQKTVLFAALLLAACSSDPVGELSGDGNSGVPSKIVNTPADAAGEVLVVRFGEDAVPALEAAAAAAARTRSAVTRSGLTDVDDILSGLALTSLERVFPAAGKHEARTRAAGLHQWYLLRFAPDQNLEEAARSLSVAGEIRTIQFSRKLRKAFDGQAVPFREAPRTQGRAFIRADFNDPELYWQWHYINNADQAVATTSVPGADIGVADAWRLSTGDPRVVVAVVDEGVKYTHPDLADNMWTDSDPDSPTYGKHGYNFIDQGELSWDNVGANGNGDVGHGTHVAGTVAAVNNNGIGVCGIAGGNGTPGSGVRIMSCQIFSGGTQSTDVQSSQAIKYAADHGAAIIQCSYGFSAGDVRSDKEYETDSPLEKAAIDYFRAQKNCEALDGGLVIYAAGNDGQPLSGYPGAYRDYISVTAFSPDFLPAYYTNYGPGCNIAAPGGETVGLSGGEHAGILSTLTSEASKTDYGYMQGTSMACPHVSGVAALGLSYALAKGKHFTLDEFNAMILTSVNNMDRFLGDGVKVVGSSKLFLSDYRGKMGTGAIDAWQLLMQVEGTPCMKVAVGDVQIVSLAQFFGMGADNLTYQKIEIADADMASLGMEERPQISDGKLMIRCSKPGACRIRIHAVAGGTRPGTDTSMGGMAISKEFSLVARSVNASNGGWL